VYLIMRNGRIAKELRNCLQFRNMELHPPKRSVVTMGGLNQSNDEKN